MNLPSMKTSPDENGLPTVAFSSTSAYFGTVPKERFASAASAADTASATTAAAAIRTTALFIPMNF